MSDECKSANRKPEGFEVVPQEPFHPQSAFRTRLRVCYIVPGFPADEEDWFTPAVAETIFRMAERHEVRVITLRYPAERKSYKVRGVPVVAIGGKGLGLLRNGIQAVLEAHRKQPFDLLHAFWATEAGVVGALAAWRLGLPLIVTCAGGEPVAQRDIGYGDWRSFRMRGCIRTALGRADVIVAGSEYQRRLISTRNAAWSAKTVTIPLGVDTQRFHPAEKKASQEVFTLLHVAGLVPVKNHRLLLRALERLRDRPWRLEIVGDGPLRESLQAYSRTLGIEDRIAWRGWVHHREMVACYQGADLFMLTSDHEAQCLALLEAMACGLPVVATAVGLAPELLGDGYVPCGDDRKMADEITAFLDHPERRRTAGEDNRRAAERYDQRIMVARLSEKYGRKYT